MTVRMGMMILIALQAVTAAAAPLRQHPANPRYFLYRGKPAVIVGSGEHYGAVLNLDFDYVRYLDELSRSGLNHTRTFAGAYCETPGNFQIAGNTLAPAEGRFIAPWARSDRPGYPGGGARFDLSRWDPAYFQRLKDFLARASRRDIIVELTLFCPFYDESMWRLSPMNEACNINGIGKVKRTDVYTLDRNGGLLAVQEAMTRKIVTEVNGFDNLYFEICNEPYFGGVTMEWQRRIADVILDTEKGLAKRHLISMNIANGSQAVRDPHPGVSILNFHYAHPPAAVGANERLGRIIGDNETGFRGTGDTTYRMEAWEFILAGGGLFSHLDYSFAVGHEDGSFVYPQSQPGGGNRGFRAQMRILKDFIHRFDFLRMKPYQAAVAATPEGTRAAVLAEPGRQYAVYLFGSGAGPLKLEAPAGRYAATWVDTLTGARTTQPERTHAGGPIAFDVPDHADDIALELRAVR